MERGGGGGQPAWMRVRPLEAADVADLQALEVRAGAIFRSVGMDEIANDDPPSTTAFAAYLDGGGLVATVEGRIAGYLLVEQLDDGAHIEQVSVDPAWARRGIGARLIDEAAAWGAARGLGALTLTTFADVPWNAPYYRRLGFRDLDIAAQGPGVRARMAEEASHGLDRWPRVVLRREISRPS